jgi:hypothetical protein
MKHWIKDVAGPERAIALVLGTTYLIAAMIVMDL